MPGRLLATKLYIPRPPPKRVARPRLVERLEEGVTSPLTLLSAPAGFGKTTLLAEWVGVRRRPPGWISLDQGDNDPARFLAYLVAALQTIDANAGRETLSLFASPQPPPLEALLTSLISELEAVQSSLPTSDNGIALVLDDYHVIHSPEVHWPSLFCWSTSPPPSISIFQPAPIRSP